MTEVLSRLLKKLPTAEALGLALIFLALQTLVYGISASLQYTDTGKLIYVSLIAAWLGFGLGKSRLNGIEASAAVLALGALGVWILGAGLVSPLLELSKAVLSLGQQIVPVIRSHTAIDMSQVTAAWDLILKLSSALLARLAQWILDINRNAKVYDPLLRSMAWLLILWFLSAWIGWFAQRRNALRSLLPAVLLLAFITSYSESALETLWLMIFILLLLMGVWNYRNHTQQWESRRIDYSDSIRVDLGQAAFFLSMGIATLAFITPSISWREVRDYLRERNPSTQNRPAEILGIREKPAVPKNAHVQRAELPREHLLSEAPAQLENIVMTIRTGELPPIAGPFIEVSAPRYYWRSVIYDQYVGSGWLASSAPRQKYPANTPLFPGLLSGYKLLHINVQMQEPEGHLFWSGILFSADVPMNVEWRLKPPTGLFADQAALIQADMFAAAGSARAYEAVSYVPDITIPELRAASTDYPDAIRKRYLALPGSVPERVRQLAEEIAQGKVNPYDKAKAIEGYLRANYPYDLEIPAPPEGVDVADYFLFDLKRGYCDYFATAMVVLTRSIGIPARFVSGYSPGTYDAPNAEYVIRELNAHSWAEIYFPEIGWIEFEPTASLSAIERAETREVSPAAQQTDAAASKLLGRFRLERIGYFALPILIILIGCLLYFTLIEKWRYMRLAPAVAIENIYRRFYRAGRPLAGAWTQAETSKEFTEKLAMTIDAKQAETRFKNLYTDVSNEVASLTETYHSALFRDVHMQKNDFLIAWRAWRHLRWRLWIAGLPLASRISKLFN